MKVERYLKKDISIASILSIIAFLTSFSTIRKIGFWARDTPHTIGLISGRPGLFAVSRKFTKVNCACLPVNIFNYIGANITTLRLMQATFLALAVLASYFLFKFVSGKKIAIVSSILLIITPLYTSTCLEMYPFLPLFVILSTFLTFNYIKKERGVYAYLATIVLGLGISTRLNLLYFLGALIPSLFLIHFVYGMKIFKKKSMKVILICLVLFSLVTVPVTRHLVDQSSDEIKEGIDIGRKHRGFIKTLSFELFAEGFRKVFYVGERRMAYSSHPFNGNNTWQKASAISLVLFFLSCLGYLYGWYRERLNVWEKSIFIIFLLFLAMVFLSPSPAQSIYFHQILPFIVFITVLGLRKIDKRILLIGLIILVAANGIRLYQFNNLLNDRNRLEVQGPSFAHLEGDVINHVESRNISKMILIEHERIRGLQQKMEGDIKFLSIEHAVGRNPDSSERILDFLRDEIINNTYLILPVKNWKETKAHKIIYYCSRENSGNWCDMTLRAFNEYIKESDAAYKTIGKIRSSNGIKVYNILKVIKKS